MIVENLKELMDSKKYSQLKNEYAEILPADIAEFLEQLEDKQLLIAFRLLPKEIAADVFSYLPSDIQAEISELINEKELSSILDDLYFDDKVDFLEEMPANVVKKILQNTSDLERKMINQFLLYPEDSAGSIMTIEYTDLKKEMLIGEAFEHIRKTAPDKETVYTCYVTDSSRHLEGIVSLKDIMLAPDDIKVSEIMKTNPVFLYTFDDREHVADQFKKYDLMAAPIVDKEQRLVGIITIDDIIDVIEDETTEDFYRMAAVTPSSEEYINSGIIGIAKNRVIWLLILMISATFTGIIISGYENALNEAIVLAAFIPMLMGTAGNAGAQASTIVIRSLVLGEVVFKDIFRIMWKELRISALVGFALSVLNFLRIYYIEKYTMGIALTVCFTLFITIIVAKVIGGVLPLLVKKAKLDPAIVASPIITTIIDTVALIIYFNFALWLMGLTR